MSFHIIKATYFVTTVKPTTCTFNDISRFFPYHLFISCLLMSEIIRNGFDHFKVTNMTLVPRLLETQGLLKLVLVKLLNRESYLNKWPS